MYALSNLLLNLALRPLLQCCFSQPTERQWKRISSDYSRLVLRVCNTP